MFKVAFFQFLPVFNDVMGNLAKITQLCAGHKKIIETADIVVLPEYGFSGPQSIMSRKEYLARLHDAGLLDYLRGLSRSHPKQTFIFGAGLLPEGAALRNTALALRAGKELLRYDKKALIYDEQFLCESTATYPVIKVGTVRVGVAICWDLILPEVFRKFAGIADVVVVPSFWGVGGNKLQTEYSFSLEKKYYRELCVARAYENAFALVFVNAVGAYTSPHYSDRMMGGSLAVLPPYGEIYHTNNKRPGQIHTVNLDMTALAKFREYYAITKEFDFYKTKKIF